MNGGHGRGANSLFEASTKLDSEAARLYKDIMQSKMVFIRPFWQNEAKSLNAFNEQSEDHTRRQCGRFFTLVGIAGDYGIAAPDLKANRGVGSNYS
jgi:hypothetical protein